MPAPPTIPEYEAPVHVYHNELDIIVEDLKNIVNLVSEADKERTVNVNAKGRSYEVTLETMSEYVTICADRTKLVVDRYFDNVGRDLKKLADRIPVNQRGLRDILEDVSRALSHGPVPTTWLALKTAVEAPMHPMDTEKPIFNRKDLDDLWQEGFEAGYKKGLHSSSGDDLSDQIDHLDL